MNVTIRELFDLDHSLAGAYLKQFDYPWEALAGIKALIVALGERLDPDEYDQPSEQVWIAKSAKLFPTAHIGAPCIIGRNTEVRHGAFIRESALVGDDCVVGNSTELKNVILFDRVQVPHYNYVGDSILGYRAHMGAGAITSNIKSDHSLICIRQVVPEGAAVQEEAYQTGLIKIGAMLGDRVEVGCNSVLNPGSIVGRGSSIYPLSLVRGVVPSNCILKANGVVVGKV